LAGVFGVDPVYFLEGRTRPPVIDREFLNIFRDETTSAMNPSGREKQTILNIIKQFEDMRDAEDEDR
jgi:ABC-type nitrate/sulfonate/bicarbonate transport system ATPase subunit